jgi:chromosome segregation ATPase
MMQSQQFPELFGGFQGTGAQSSAETDKKLSLLAQRITEVEERLAGKTEELRQRYESVLSRLGPDTVEKLQKVMSSSHDILDRMVPEKVKEQASIIMTGFSSDIRALSEDIHTLAKETEKMNMETGFSFSKLEKIEQQINRFEERLTVLERELLSEHPSKKI